MDDPSSTWRIFTAIGLIALNAFFVASEMAIARAKPHRIREYVAKNNRRFAELALDIIQNKHIDSYLSACQLGITATVIAFGWICIPAVEVLLEPLFIWLGIGESIGLALASAIGFAIAVILLVVLGELIPKRYTAQRAEAVLLRCSRPMQVFYMLMYPFVWLVNKVSQVSRGALGYRNGASVYEAMHTEEDIRMIISAGEEQGILAKHEAELVKKILDYSDRIAGEVMTPRNDVTVLFTDQTLEEAVQFVLTKGYTRYPLCKEDRDHVVGIVHIRDLFAARCSGAAKKLEDIAREPLVIPETLPLPQVRMKFQESNQQMAILVDEYGTFSGLVTLEDMIEEVFGDFRDEFDEVEPAMVRQTENGLELDAGMLVEEAFETLGIDQEYLVEGINTIGGLVFSMLAEKPELGDQVQVDGYQLEVAAVDGLRITWIRAKRLDNKDESGEPGESGEPEEAKEETAGKAPAAGVAPAAGAAPAAGVAPAAGAAGTAEVAGAAGNAGGAPGTGKSKVKNRSASGPDIDMADALANKEAAIS